MDLTKLTEVAPLSRDSSFHIAACGVRACGVRRDFKRVFGWLAETWDKKGLTANTQRYGPFWFTVEEGFKGRTSGILK